MVRSSLGPDGSVASTAYSEEFDSDPLPASDEILEEEGGGESAVPSGEVTQFSSQQYSGQHHTQRYDSGTVTSDSAVSEVVPPSKDASASGGAFKPPSGSYSSEVFEEEVDGEAEAPEEDGEEEEEEDPNVSKRLYLTFSIDSL